MALEPTPLFPKVKPGEPLRQIARLKLENGGPAVDAHVKITAAGQQPYRRTARPGRAEGIGQGDSHPRYRPTGRDRRGTVRQR